MAFLGQCLAIGKVVTEIFLHYFLSVKEAFLFFFVFNQYCFYAYKNSI